MSRRYYRSSSDKVIAGVCGGLADYFNIDPLLVRIVMLILFFGYGFGLIPYLIIWLLAPKN